MNCNPVFYCLKRKLKGTFYSQSRIWNSTIRYNPYRDKGIIYCAILKNCAGYSYTWFNYSYFATAPPTINCIWKPSSEKNSYDFKWEFCPRNLNQSIRKYWTPLLVPLGNTHDIWLTGSAHNWLPVVHGNTLGRSSFPPAPSTPVVIPSWANVSSVWEIHGMQHTVRSRGEALLHT